MATNVSTPAWKTRLGNATAKSVLARFADQVNSDGFGWPSLEFIATETEISLRTVMRMVQVFRAMGLLVRIDRGRRRTPGWQISLEMLGCDLEREFALAYERAQGKAGPDECRRDSERSVAETVNGVAQTLFSVAETLPPHPLIGGTVKEPLRNQTPPTPSRGEGDGGRQMAIERGIDQVCSALAIANRRKRRLLEAVIKLEAEKGDPVPTIALAMIAAWNKQAGYSHLLRAPYGFDKFFGLGIWKDENRWLWNNELLRERAAASVGSR